MARYNKKTATVKRESQIINRAGGRAYKHGPKFELVEFLLTNFMTPKYYESAADAQKRLVQLVNDNDPEFVAKAAVYARNTFGMRTVTHVTACELFKACNKRGESPPWMRQFVKNVVFRVDDMTEIMAYWLSNQEGKRRIPNALKRGLADKFGDFDTYQLGKYRGEGKAVSLRDLMNLVHPIPSERNGEVTISLAKYWAALPLKLRKSKYEDNIKNVNGRKTGTIKINAIEALKLGLLKADGTWQKDLSAAGKTSDKKAAKADVWKKQIREKKIGIMALLRNLRNIVEQAPDLIDEAAELLQNERLLLSKNNKMFPYRYYNAYKAMTEVSNSRKMLRAISKACDIAVGNVPELANTLVAVDVSGSMGGGSHFKVGNTSHGACSSTVGETTLLPVEIGALFGASLFKKGECDLMAFASDATFCNYNPDDTVIGNTEKICKLNGVKGHGTNFHAIFDRAKEKYERIVIFTDCQGWMGYDTPEASINKWMRRVGQKEQPWIYTVNLAGHGNTVIDPAKPKNIALAGFSDKIFDLMYWTEIDKNALITVIEKIEF